MDREREADEECAEEPQLQGSRVEDAGEVRAAVIEHHDLVDHRELEMGCRVVNRDAAVLGEEHDQEGEGDQGEGRRGLRPDADRHVGQHRRQRQASRLPRDGRQSEEERGLRQGRERDLAARAHALEAGSRVERGDHRREARESEEVREQKEVPREGHESRGAEGHEGGRHDHGRQSDDGPGPEHPARRPAVHGTLRHELPEVVVGLEQRLADPSRNDGLRPIDHTEQQRREAKSEQQRQYGSAAHGSPSFQTRSTSSVRPM